MTNPKVSVVMPVYNAAKHLRAAMNSVLAQTFEDLELVVVDDGSTDDSMDVVESYRDKRVRVVRHATNQGLAAARNTGLKSARGEFVAWLDADDTCRPDRLKEQVKLLKSNESIGICGTWVKTIGDQLGHRWRYPADGEILKARMLFDDPFATSSVMLRRSVLVENGLTFDPDYPPAEDYELWERVLQFSRGANVPKFLTFYRLHGTQTSINAVAKQRASVWRIQERQLHRLGIVPTAEEKEIHTKLGRFEYFDDNDFIRNVREWLERLLATNNETGVYPRKAFDYVLYVRWVGTCAAARARGFGALQLFYSSPLAKVAGALDARRLYFIARCIAGTVLRLVGRETKGRRQKNGDTVTKSKRV